MNRLDSQADQDDRQQNPCSHCILFQLGPGAVNGKKKKAKLTKFERRERAKMEKKMKKKLTMTGANKTGPEALRAAKKGGAGNQVKPIYNSEGKMVFSKFDFTEEQKDQKKPQIDPKSALKKIQKEKDKLKSLEEIGKSTTWLQVLVLPNPQIFDINLKFTIFPGKTERVKIIEEKTAWKTALDKAQGVKVKDDVSLLKKSIKKIEQKKKSSKKKWDERKDNVEKRKEGKQSKREENIQRRKHGNKQNKAKKLAKKGRSVPGFR